MIERVHTAGSVGVNRDLSKVELPVQAWTDAQNIRFLDGLAYQFYGHGSVYGVPPVAPHHVAPFTLGGVRYWIYLGLAKAYIVTLDENGDAVHTDITRPEDFEGALNLAIDFAKDPLGDYLGPDKVTVTISGDDMIFESDDGTTNLTNGLFIDNDTGNDIVATQTDPKTLTFEGAVPFLTDGDQYQFDYAAVTYLATSTGVSGDYLATPNTWTSTLLGGIPVFNNEIDLPQWWDLDLSGKAHNLANWPVRYACRSLRSYNQFLVALGITKDGVEFPYMVKWSHPADPGALPVSWDETDPIYDAGETDLAEGYDCIVDGLQLRDSFMIYKERSIWRMDLVGGPFVFRFSKVLGESGALNKNCIVEVDGWHFVLTGSDVITHDGHQSTSVLDKQTRRYLFQNFDVDQVHKAFVFKNPFLNEVFVCYASVGSEDPDRAMVWNYVDRTVSFRSIPNLNHGADGPVSAGLDLNWNTDAAPWDTDLTAWDGPEFTPDTVRVLMASNDTKLFLLDSSASFDGEIPEAYMERTGLALGGEEQRTLITRIRPRITGNIGDTVVFKVAGTEDPYETPNYVEERTFTIGETVSCDFLVSGRYMAIRIETGTAYQWRLDSYDIEYEDQGQW